MGTYAAKIIKNEIEAEKEHAIARPSRKPFHYWDKGSLATIGRRRAVGLIANTELSGLLAWLGWLFIHLMYLVGFRNRLLVFLQWGWTYVAYETGARLITDPSSEFHDSNNQSH
jgi:NADH dehydrogenase